MINTFLNLLLFIAKLTLNISYWVLKSITLFLTLFFIGFYFFWQYDREVNLQSNHHESLTRYTFWLIDRTKYSKDFTYAGYRKIRRGMSKNQIYQFLGPPLQEDCWEKLCSLIYTKQSFFNSGPYDRKIIETKDNKVIDIIDEYHPD